MRTGIAPDVWRRQTDTDIATAIHLLSQQDRQDHPDNEPGQGYNG